MNESTRNPSPFPATRHSVVLSLRSDEAAQREQAYAALIEAYWRPVYGYLRLRRRLAREQAEDFTQGFFTFALERGTLAGYDASKARFRTWLRLCLDGWVDNQLKAASRQKRGGGVAHVGLDFENAEGELQEREIPVEAEIEGWFHREWMRSLFALALEDLRRDSLAKQREVDLRIFERHDLEAPESNLKLTYAELAAELDVPVTKITNALHAMRKRLREHLLARLRKVCASDAEYAEEVRALFGGDPS